MKIRASQLNGCTYCVDMHTKDARARGEGEQRVYALPVWHETPFFTDRERAALAWTEAITLLPGHRVTDELYQGARQHFSEKQLVDLTMAIIAIGNVSTRFASRASHCRHMTDRRWPVATGCSGIAPLEA